jgi:hypothetical protein
MRENVEIVHNAMFCHTQKKDPLESAAILPPTSPIPHMWTMGIPVPKIATISIMIYPDRRPASTSVPYSHTARITTGMTILNPPCSIPRAISSEM